MNKINKNLCKFALNLIQFKRGEARSSTPSIKQILKKYKRENIIDNEKDLKILNRYAATGMVSFNIKIIKNHTEPTAKLTDTGRWFITQLD
ncbi:hypothetical protein M1278_03480 [Candidatus Marsarchaeota archaeon]|jgi:hypothetical protein|nr:hypothetical protein [Candidatus Marsarchaeota archaeon]